MPIKTTCPECDKAYTLADTMAGKSVKCKGCGNPFTVQGGANGIAARPSNGKVMKAAAKKVVADDDDGDEPVKKKGGMGLVLLLGGGLVAVLMLLVCGGVGIGAVGLGLGWWSWSKASSDTASNTTSTDKDKDKDKDKDSKDKDPNKDKDKPNNPQPPVAADKLTPEMFQRIKGHMTVAEVEGILGKPRTSSAFGDGTTTVATWLFGQDSASVNYVNGKVDLWSASIERKIYGPYRADTPGGPGPNPTTAVTKANFDKIKGGMNEGDLFLLLGFPNNGNAPAPAEAADFDKSKTQVWQDGNHSITVTYCNGKAAYAAWMFQGQKVNGWTDPLSVVKKTAPANTITKENYDKIKGGETEDQLKALLGKISNMNGATDPESAKYDEKKLHVRTWMDSKGIITVAFCDGKAAHWTGLIDGQVMEAKTNQQFAILKKDLPVPTTPVTKANYDLIMKNMAETAVALLLGKPSLVSPRETFKATKQLPAHQRFFAKWTDGQGGEVTIHFIDFGAGATVDRKEHNNRLK